MIEVNETPEDDNMPENAETDALPEDDETLAEGETSQPEAAPKPKRELTEEERHVITLGNEIADGLGETAKQPRRLVKRVIEKCGEDFAKEAYQETLEIEENGGILTQNMERRRTRGGIFFYLVKGRLSVEKRQEVFPHLAENYFKSKKKRPVLDWSQRLEVMSQIKKIGKIDTMIVKIIGRPGAIVKKDDTVVTKMLHESGSASLPIGLPELPEEPMPYTVYIANQQWKKIEKQVKGGTMIEVEGLCRFDPEGEGIAVFTTSVKIRKPKEERQKEHEEAKQQQAAQNAVAEQQAPKAEKKAKSGKQEKPAKAEAKPAKAEAKPAKAPTTMPELEIPPGIPMNIEQKLRELHSAAQQYREKIADLESKPENEQFGLAMTQKLLANVEKQMNTLLSRYN